MKIILLYYEQALKEYGVLSLVIDQYLLTESVLDFIIKLHEGTDNSKLLVP